MDLGTTVRAGAMLAPKAFGYDRERHRPAGGGQGRHAHSGRLRLSRGAGRRALQLRRPRLGSGSARRDRRRQDRVRGTWRSPTWKEAGSRTRCPGAEFDLGLSVGPRAFRSHAFTGRPHGLRDRRVPGDRGRRFSRPRGLRRGGVRGPRWCVVQRITRGGSAGIRVWVFGWVPPAHRPPRRCGSTWPTASRTTHRAPAGC